MDQVEVRAVASGPGGVVGDRFSLERAAGSGGMGAVFFARDLRDGSPVAVKVMTGVAEDDAGRFAREVEILATLRHPGIVRYIAHGLTPDGSPFVAMEWLEGCDLSHFLIHRRLSPGESVTLARRAADALGFAHEHGIVHRDVKPGNLFLVGGDVERVKVIDFGIARVARLEPRLTGTGMILGTPAYMAPEQIQGRSAPEPTIDVFALGCVIYECLTGTPAFDGINLMAQFAKILLQEAPSVRASVPDVPPPLDRLVSRMLAKAPEHRPANGAAVAAELTKLADHSGAWTVPPPSPLASELARLAVAANPAITRDEQRVVTLVLAGDPDAAPDSVRRRDDTATELQAAIAPYGGRVDALGGGSLIVTVWGGDGAADRAERAAHCALSVRARFPLMPISITTGRGRVAARVVEGAFLDQAIQLLRRAQPGLVRLDAATADMLRGRFHVEDQGSTFLLREEWAPEEGATLLLGKPSQCVGRSRELSVLEGLLAGCATESMATVALVTGAPGSGKSRLGRELLEKVRQGGDGVTVLSGRGASTATGSPFWMLADALRRASGIRDGDAPAARREKLAARIGRHVKGAQRARVIGFLGAMSGTSFPDADEAFLAASGSPMLMGDSMRAAWQDWLAAESEAHPVLLVLEDLHWGDAATVSLLDATLRNLRDRPLMVLALARPEVDVQFPKLWASRDVQVVRLGPLGRRACERLVADALGDGSAAVMDRVVERAAGNPFYLEELVRAVAAGRGDAFPDSVLGAVEARLDAEGSEAKRVLRAASVFGERFSRDGVAALLGGAAYRAEVGEWLELLATHELVTVVGSAPLRGNVAYAFGHALLHDAAHAMLTEDDRVLGHRLAGAWLEQAGHPDDMAIAEHFRRGGEPARAVSWYQRAAEHALEANELAAAIERVALGIAAGASGDALSGLGLVESEARVWRGELALAEARSREVTTLVASGTTPWFRAVTQAVNAAGKLGGFDRVLGWVAPAVAARPELGALGAQVSCLAWIGTHLIFGGRYDDADAVLAELTRAAGDLRGIEPQAVAGLHGVRAIRATVRGDLGAGLDGFRAALTAFEQTGDQRNAAAVRSNLGFVLGELGDFAGAEEALRGALSAAERMGLHDLTTASLHNLGRVVAHLGRIEEARALERRALDAYTEQRDPRMAGSARAYLAQIALLAGDFAEAEQEARAAAEALRVAPPLRAGALSVLARALLAQGRAAEALVCAREAFSQLETLGSLEEGESMVRLAYAEALAALGAERSAAAASGARARLLERAARISDPAWREQFLRSVPENARTLALGVA
jgi:tetratricopeptide (TPR) repeat protein